MVVTIATDGNKAWLARIIGDCNKFGYQRQFMPRLHNAERGTGLARFTIPDDVSDSYEVCYGDPACRQFIEIYPPTADAAGFWFAVALPGEELGPGQTTYSLTEPLVAPAVNPSRTKFDALLKSYRAAWTEDDFDGW